MRGSLCFSPPAGRLHARTSYLRMTIFFVALNPFVSIL
jgi:hypothetical protein